MPTTHELLQQHWSEKTTADDVMAVRVELQRLKQTADQAEAAINKVVARESFKNVHADLKTEGKVCRGILNQFIADFAEHAEFIDFQPDQ